MPRLTGRQVVAIVVAICCAVVLQPVASNAAGALSTLVDRYDNNRQTRVTTHGALLAETRPGPLGGQFIYSSNTTTTNWTFPVQTTGPTATALTNITISNFYDSPTRVLIQAFVRTSGTQGCANLSATMSGTPAGWTARSFGIFMIPANDSIVLPLTQAWTVATTSGVPACIGYKALFTGGTLYSSITGYRYTP
jgi:hypothetical protein